MTTSEEYVNQVLDVMPRAVPTRSQIAMELRGHIAERIAHGQSLDDVLRQLGDPVTLADSYLSAEPLVSASFGRRALAKAIDVACVEAAMTPVVWFFARLAPWELFIAVVIAGYLVVGSLVFGIYTVVAERWFGQTVGKYGLGLRVVHETGRRIGLIQAIVRTLPMFLQIYWIDVFFALFTEKSQRAFEVLSKTRVVGAFSSNGQ
jgi:uncharacterized RDD family membrane protein YckC